MSLIEKSLPKFSACLEQNIPIICDKSGRWHHDNLFNSTFRWITGNEDPRLINIGRTFCSVLDRLEKKPVIFSNDPEIVEAQKTIYEAYFKAAKAVKKALKTSKSQNVHFVRLDLSQRVAALKYRIEKVHGGLDKVKPDSALFTGLMAAAAAWKKKETLFPNKALSQRDKNKIIELSCYPEFSKLLLKSSPLQKKAFSWLFKDNNGVSQLAQFPATSNRIKMAYLAARVGRINSDLFAIQKHDIRMNGTTAKEKVITLPFHTKHKVEHISILNEEREVELNGGWRLTIKEILRIFGRKNDEIGDLEFFGSTGINNWNAHEMGWWDPQNSCYVRINLDEPEWWMQLPVFEELTKEQLESRYHVKMNAGEWLACAMAARESADLDLDGRHGYLVVAIPTPEGRYRMIPLGKFPQKFPNGVLQLLKFLTATVRAKVSFPDENEYYSHRQKAAHPMRMTKKQGLDLMSIIRHEIMEARNGNSYFQFGCENCAFWVQLVFDSMEDKKIPNFYKLAMLESQPGNPLLKNIFKFLRQSPESLRPGLVSAIDRVFGSWRGLPVMENGQIVYKSMMESPVRAEQVIFQPGHLHEQIIEGKLKGVIFYGH